MGRKSIPSFITDSDLKSRGSGILEGSSNTSKMQPIGKVDGDKSERNIINSEI